MTAVRHLLTLDSVLIAALKTAESYAARCAALSVRSRNPLRCPSQSVVYREVCDASASSFQTLGGEQHLEACPNARAGGRTLRSSSMRWQMELSRDLAD